MFPGIIRGQHKNVIMVCKKIRIIAAILFAGILLAGCSAGTGQKNSDVSCSRDIFAMDTYMTITCYGERASEACDAAEEEIRRLDSLLSAQNPDSEISRLNQNGSAALSSDSRILVEEALRIYQMTDGAFDITIYPLMELWGFTSRNYSVPDADQIAAALSLVGSDRLTCADGVITLAEGQGIDLGGIAKGYTSDRLTEIFSEYGLTSGLISLGGNVQLYHSKPDGTLWQCGIRDPNETGSPQDIMGVLSAENCAVITSGAYERFFTADDGQTWHHIIDPSTGYPASAGLISVTIVSESGILADALSTAVYVMGLEKAAEFWRQNRSDFEMILMTDDQKVYITEGLKGLFTTDYELHVISGE